MGREDYGIRLQPGGEKMGKQLGWSRRGPEASSKGVACREQRSRENSSEGPGDREENRRAVAGSPTHALGPRRFSRLPLGSETAGGFYKARDWWEQGRGGAW